MGQLKLNNCSLVTDDSILAVAFHCPSMLEIDLHNCRQITDESITSLISSGRQLRELRIGHCTMVTNNAFLEIPPHLTFESLRILDLTACTQVHDEAIEKIIETSPRLRNLVLAKCRELTDRSVLAITRLGKNLHYIHLGHCAQVSDAAIIQLVKLCNRIRYIDLACCHRLTDLSVKQLATLPKLRRIGLVKCASITDKSILALAKANVETRGKPQGPSFLERVHLSYCVHLSVPVSFREAYGGIDPWFIANVVRLGNFFAPNSMSQTHPPESYRGSGFLYARRSHHTLPRSTSRYTHLPLYKFLLPSFEATPLLPCTPSD